MSELPFFFFPPSALDLGAALRVVFSLGMVMDGLVLMVSYWRSDEQLVGKRKGSRQARQILVVQSSSQVPC